MSADILQLRPMTAGDILDRAIRIYRRNFVPLVTIVAIVTLPFALVQVFAALISYPLNPSQFDAGVFEPGRLLLGQGLQYLAAFAAAIAAIFQNAALAAFVSEKFLGRGISVRQAYRHALHRWLSLLIAIFLIGMVNVIVFGVLFGVFLVPLIGIASLGSGADSGASAVFGIMSLAFCCLLAPALVVAIFLNTRWAFFIQAIVLENFNSTGSMGRSWKLVKGSFWRVLFMLFVIALIINLFSVGPILLVTAAATLLASPVLIALASAVSGALVSLLFAPLQFAALTVLYYDLRIRKEGFDLELQMQDLSGAAPPALPLTSAPQPPSAPAAPGETQSDLPPLYSRDDYRSLRDQDTEK